MTAVEFISNRTFTLADFDRFIGRLGNEQLLPLPNADDSDPMAFLNNIASGGHGLKYVWGYARLPDNRGAPGSRNQWTQFALTTHMGGALDGGGYAVTYGGQRVIDGKMYQTPIVRRFAICRHEVEDHPGANHNRGWHPGHCRLCGFNMTYDSGD